MSSALLLLFQAILAAGIHAAVPGLSFPALLGGAALGVLGGHFCARRVCSAGRAGLLLALTMLAGAAALTARRQPAALVGFQLPALPFAWTLALSAWSALAAWQTLRRGRAAPAALLGVLWLAGVNAATTADMSTLAGALAAGTLFVLAAQHAARERAWEAEGSDYPTALRLDVAVAALGLSAALVAAALLLSAPSPQAAWRATGRLTAPLRARLQRLNRTLGLRAPPPGSGAAERDLWGSGEGLPRQRLLGSGPELAEIPVASIQVSADLAEGGFAPYWRETAYDRYTGLGWVWSEWQPGEWQPAFVAALPQGVLWQQVTRLDGRAYAPALAFGDILALERQAQTVQRPPEAPLAFAVQGRRYAVWSQPPLATPGQLRAASAAYPAWVRQRYLSLPQSTPPRLRALALELTRGASTPYDKAALLETYLRSFPYTLDLPAPPQDRDVAAYFLFELRRGYCDYYATAFAALARAAGLPTRLAVGYLGGAYDPQTRTYTITEADAHSWPEVYFPGYGWVPFEPTAGRPALLRPQERPALPVAPPARPALAEALSLAWRRSGRAGGLLLAATLLGLGAALFWGWETLRLRRLPPRRAVLHLWGRAVRWAERSAAPPQRGSTPLETASRLKGNLAPLLHLPAGRRMQAEAVRAVEHLVGQVHLAWFGPHPPRDIPGALRAWRRVRAALLLSRAVALWRAAAAKGQALRRRNPHGG